MCTNLVITMGLLQFLGRIAPPLIKQVIAISVGGVVVKFLETRIRWLDNEAVRPST